VPIPKPKKSEKEQEFISRCMGSDLMRDEYPDQKQRSAICYDQWRTKEVNKVIKLNFQVPIKEINTRGFHNRRDSNQRNYNFKQP